MKDFSILEQQKNEGGEQPKDLFASNSLVGIKKLCFQMKLQVLLDRLRHTYLG